MQCALSPDINSNVQGTLSLKDQTGAVVPLSNSTKKITHEELMELYERENKRGGKNIGNIARLLGNA